MKVIAIEEHFTHPTLYNEEGEGELGDHPIMAGIRKKLRDLGRGRIAEMDAAGIDVQVLSHAVPGAEALKPEEAHRASQANDALADAISHHPDRFAGFAALPMQAPDAAADELRRAVTELGLKGAMLNGLTTGRFLDDAAFQPVLAAAEALRVPLYLHPALPPKPVLDAYFSGLSDLQADNLATAAWGWHSETAVHLLRLIVSGVLDEYPDLQIIIGHMGEMIPFALSRIDVVLTPINEHLRQPVADYFKTNVHITTSGYATFPPLQCALAVLGADRIIFSVDHPYTPNEPMVNLLKTAPIDEADREKIAHGNVEKLLRL